MRTGKTTVMVALLLAVWPMVSLAQWRTPQGETLADESWRKHQGDFSAMLQLAPLPEHQRFLHEWSTTSSDHTPSLTTTAEARRGDIVVATIAYAGCAANPVSGACDAELSYRVLRPDGSVYGEYSGVSLAGEQLPGGKMVQLSPSMLHIRFEPEDPLGTYIVQAEASDPTLDVRLQLDTSIELKDFAAAAGDH